MTKIKNGTVLAMSFAALFAVGCALSTVQTFMRNVSASDCATPAAQQAFVGNLPQVAFMTNQQALAAMQHYCVGAFGTVAAPTPAPGMTGAFDSASPTPTAVATPSVGGIPVPPTPTISGSNAAKK